MPKVRNVSGHTLWLGDGRRVDDDSTFECPERLLEGYLCQPSNWELVETPRRKADKSDAVGVEESE